MFRVVLFTTLLVLFAASPTLAQLPSVDPMDRASVADFWQTFYPAAECGTELMPSPIKLVDAELPRPARAPTLGQHAGEILRDVLGYDEARLDSLHESGTLG